MRIRAKQIHFNNSYELIYGNSLNGGSYLSLGQPNQYLGVDSSNILMYRYVSQLREAANGELVIDGIGIPGSANYLQVSNSVTNSPVIIEPEGTDLDISLRINPKNSGNVIISDNIFPNTIIPAFSVLNTQSTAGTLNISTVPNLTTDHVLAFNSNTSQIVWIDYLTLLNNNGGAFNTVNVNAGTGGDHSGTQPLLATTGSSIQLTAIDGIRFISSNTAPQTVQMGLSFSSLTQETNLTNINTTTFRIAYYDTTTQDHKTITFEQLKSLLDSNISVITTSVTALPFIHYIINAANLTITLPASPIPGTIIKITNVSNFFDSVVNRNGNLLNGQASNLIIDTNYETLTFIFVNSTIGWIYY